MIDWTSPIAIDDSDINHSYDKSFKFKTVEATEE
jgi:hypothetical protein